MSFCPTRDLHSVYLDNELPEIYKAEYEEHVKNCPACQKQLNDLKVLHGLLQSDSKSITPDSHYLDQSYERLMVKMKYSKNASKAAGNPFVLKSKSVVYIASAVAAAAVLAIVMPVGLRSGKQNNVANVASIASLSNVNTMNNVGVSSLTNSAVLGGLTSVGLGANGSSLSSVNYKKNNAYNNQYNSGRSVVISGNIDESVLTSVKAVNATDVARNASSVLNSQNPGNMKIEFFRPDFSEAATITIKVTVPGMNAVPVTAEYEVPVPVITGR